jgi:hypothetical protein
MQLLAKPKEAELRKGQGGSMSNGSPQLRLKLLPPAWQLAWDSILQDRKPAQDRVGVLKD